MEETVLEICIYDLEFVVDYGSSVEMKTISIEMKELHPPVASGLTSYFSLILR